MHNTINLDFIKTEIGNDHSVISEMLVIFQEVLTEFEQTIATAIDDKSYSSMFIATHKIKPSLKMFGLHELVALTVSLEKSIKQEVDFSQLQKQFINIQQPLPDIYTNIDKLLITHKT